MMPAAELAPSLSTPTPAPATQTPAERKYQKIAAAIEDLRPSLRADGGDCELVSVEGDLVRIKMTGACIGCQFASATIHGLQERLIAALGMPLRILPVPTFR